MARGLFQSFDDTWILGGVRTPMVDYCGAFAATPTPFITVERRICLIPFRSRLAAAVQGCRPKVRIPLFPMALKPY